MNNEFKKLKHKWFMATVLFLSLYISFLVVTVAGLITEIVKKNLTGIVIGSVITIIGSLFLTYRLIDFYKENKRYNLIIEDMYRMSINKRGNKNERVYTGI